MTFRTPSTRAVARGLSLFALTAASASATVAIAEEAERPRDYAPTDIVVIAKVEGYGSDDGSTAMKTPTPLIDTPQTVQVLTRDQLDDQNVRALGDALRYVAGIAMETGEGHRDEVFIRGQKSTADFFFNGLRDDAQYYRPLYNVERVEVLKGANALTFGRGGGGGVINRVSKTADPGRAFVAGTASLDSFGAWALAADVNQPLATAAALRMNATYEEFANHRDFYDGRFLGINPTVTLEPGDKTRVALSYSYEDDSRLTDRGVPSLNGRPLGDYDKTLFGDRDLNDSFAKVHIARARIEHDLSDTLSLNATGQFASYDKAYANVVPVSTNGTSVTLNGYHDATARENWIGQANLVWQGETGPIGHTLLAGVEALGQSTGNTRRNVLFATAAGGTATSATVPLARRLALPALSLSGLARDRHSRLTALSGYVQDQLEIGEVLQLVAGVRYESFDLRTRDAVGNLAAGRKDRKWSPRFGVVVKPQANLSLYGSYSESFLPQAGDQFQLLTLTTAALAPEKFENLEAGIKWAPARDLLVSASVFRLTRSNTQSRDPLNPAVTVLTGKSRTRGFEAQVAGDLAPNWHANVGYTYLDGEIRSDTTAARKGTRLEQVPKHSFAAWTRFDFNDRLGLGAGVVHASRQYASLSNTVVLPAYTRVDAALYFEASERLSFQLNIQNLLDADYYPSAHGDNNIQPAAPFTASVSARVRL